MRDEKRDIPSFFPPTKSIPSSIALSINGLTAPVCSLICLAFAHNASETDCGSKVGRGEGRAGVFVVGGANSARTSKISSSYYPSALFMALRSSLLDYPLIRLNLGLLYLHALLGYGMTLHLSLVRLLNVFQPGQLVHGSAATWGADLPVEDD